MLRRVWLAWAVLGAGVFAGCGGGGGEGGGGGTGTTTTTTTTTTAGPACGDGKLDAESGEACDDGNTAAGDGCAADCKVETGYVCSGVPSACTTVCGDGIIAGTEKCDDGNVVVDDGCGTSCEVEAGFECTGAPSACVTVCGDSVVAGAEKCDDGNTAADDGCAADCAAVEDGFTCDTSMPSICAPLCGDSKVVGGEACDDGNTAADDGCSATCAVETGFTCNDAMPSVCAPVCGDGLVVSGETCDDMNTAAGDGCSATCATEAGYDCNGAPSICASICGDGLIVGMEICDDSNTAGSDGCAADCSAVENGWTCTGAPSVCVTTCGDGIVAGAELCDDGNTAGNDGCAADCSAVENGWTCTGSPSACSTTCGDGIIVGAETCDDGNIAASDGCNPSCKVETGWACNGAPSTCATVCGDGIIAGAEVCDDGNTAGNDGCSATCAAIDAGFTCTGAPSACVTTCGDGIRAGAETCDDSNTADADGCSAACAIEAGYGCSGSPSVCAPICGDGLKVGAEKCDDSNTANNDCCSSTCQIEAGCEIEPNDTIATANDFAMLAAGNKVKGLISPSADKDVFKITVPAGQTGSFVAKILEVPGGPTCASNQLDSNLIAFTGAGTSIGSNGDANGNYCSQLTIIGLAPGDYFIEVKRQGLGATTFPYLLQIDLTLAICANGVLELGEQCDDGNTTPGDGCNAACKLEPTPEVEPNNACGAGTSNGPYTIPPNKLVSGSLNGSVDATDWYRFTLTAYADVRIETFDSTGPGACATTDTKIQLFNSSCAALGALDDDGGIEYCSLLDPTVASQSFLKHLAPGDYYVSVIPYSSTTALFSYTMLISTPALCGNGVVEGSEQCDGGPTCQADCMLIPVCGDGIRGGSEQCDDGNTVSGDGCSATCVTEAIAEVEPNGTTAEADAALPALTTTDRVKGALATSADKDIFKFTVATAGVVRLETFDGAGADCPAGTPSHTLTLLSSTGTSLNTDTGSGIGACSAITVALDPGTYYMQVSASAAVPAYVAKLTFQASDGLETETNDTQAQANAVAGTEFFVCGTHQVNTDADVFAVTVPAGMSIRAEVVEVTPSSPGYETCEGLGVDSRVRLLGPTFTQLVADDDGSRGYCSLIDGTGAAPYYPAAHNLAAGTYYLSVEASTFSQTGAAGQFNYCLSVAIR